MHWKKHIFLAQAYYALVDKYSFLAILGDEGWKTSWQDRYKGGSASSTIEGPFATLEEAKANCERIEKALRNRQ